MTHFEFFSITFSEIILYFSNEIKQLKIINFKRVELTLIKNNHTYISKNGYQISTNIDYWQGHERNLYMVTCGLLTNHRHGNHVLMYEQGIYHPLLPKGGLHGTPVRTPLPQQNLWMNTTLYINLYTKDNHIQAKNK